MWDEIIYPFPNFNGCTVEVWEWISNFIPHFTRHMIAYPCCDLKLNHVSKRGHRQLSLAVLYEYFTHTVQFTAVHANELEIGTQTLISELRGDLYGIMMTSSNGNIFRLTGPLCGFLLSAPE